MAETSCYLEFNNKLTDNDFVCLRLQVSLKKINYIRVTVSLILQRKPDGMTIRNINSVSSEEFKVFVENLPHSWFVYYRSYGIFAKTSHNPTLTMSR